VPQCRAAGLLDCWRAQSYGSKKLQLPGFHYMRSIVSESRTKWMRPVQSNRRGSEPLATHFHLRKQNKKKIEKIKPATIQSKTRSSISSC